uniref:Uncharacterized protein LOC111102786 isoform X2 n=1 Tax=Crassostrea virginica TaxID=6565 RepID=A0A8B8AIK5_CRAVI|nr:uncharacterized protein LOC111102786 isoform X2 [Crassostrea virginica]
MITYSIMISLIGLLGDITGYKVLQGKGSLELKACVTKQRKAMGNVADGKSMSVDRCPSDKEEWEERSLKMNCSAWRSNRMYHCALNEDGDRLLEVCAPPVNIHGRSCTEFNTLGNVIQESFIRCWEACPNVYNSTEAYKYQTCYSYLYAEYDQPNESNVPSITGSEETESSTLNGPVFQSVILSLISVLILLLVLCCWEDIIKKQMIKFVEMIRKKCSGAGNHAATEGGCSVVKEQTDHKLTEAHMFKKTSNA